jgi:hypothetical protein
VGNMFPAACVVLYGTILVRSISMSLLTDGHERRLYSTIRTVCSAVPQLAPEYIMHYSYVQYGTGTGTVPLLYADGEVFRTL